MRAERSVLAAAALRPVVLLAPLLLLPGCLGAQTWRYSVSVAPSFLAPRMDEYNAALATEGINLIDNAFIAAAYAAGAPAPAYFPYYFPPIRYAYGGRAAIHCEFNEDLRGGLAIDVNAAAASETVYFPYSGVRYFISQKTSLPLVCISASLDKVFRFEEDPRFQLYLGGWGSLGNLFGQLSGDVQQLDSNLQTVNTVTYSAKLESRGWGAGGVAGVEFRVQPKLAVYAEGGFGAFFLEEAKVRLELATVPLANTAGEPVEIDFTGVFLRLGIRAALGR